MVIEIVDDGHSPTDTSRLDWLQADSERLKDVFYRSENEEESIREAIDWLRETLARAKSPPPAAANP